VIKERARAARYTLSFKVIPLLMLIDLIYSSILWINAFPPKSGVSSNFGFTNTSSAQMNLRNMILPDSQ
jgi:hypothetical protein